MRVRHFAIACVALALLFAASAMRAQDSTSKSVVTAQQNPNTQVLKFKGEVISSNAGSITLRNRDNPREVQTFIYSTQLRDKMISILKKGGYRSGDKVTVEYLSGTTIAQHISGKPSKPH